MPRKHGHYSYLSLFQWLRQRRDFYQQCGWRNLHDHGRCGNYRHQYGGNR